MRDEMMRVSETKQQIFSRIKFFFPKYQLELITSRVERCENVKLIHNHDQAFVLVAKYSYSTT